MQIIKTQRLILREWKPEDLAPFTAMNQDPKVMEFMPGPLTAELTHAFVERIKAHFADHGFGLFAVELKDTHECIGYVGLAVPTFQAHFTPCVEIGWRLAQHAWNKGYATEAAKAVLEAAFTRYGLEEVVSFTVPQNLASRRVMEKIGMTHNPADDFDHPRLPEGHPLRRHVLYRISKQQWMDKTC